MIYQVFKQKENYVVLNVNLHLDAPITVGNSIKYINLLILISNIKLILRSDYNGGTCWVFFCLEKFKLKNF